MKIEYRSQRAVGADADTLDKEILIAPFGEFDHHLGRQQLDIEAALSILARARAGNRDILVDYDHHSLNPDHARQCGAAAGWIRLASLKIGHDGIEAIIDWTEKARALIQAREYRFLSPVFERCANKIVALYNMGLTNNPNIPAVPPLINHEHVKEIKMDDQLKSALKKTLGIAPQADDDLLRAALKKVLGDDEFPSAIEPLKKTLDELAKIFRLPETYTPDQLIASALKILDELAKSRAESTERVVDDAIKSGRLAPTLKEWARDLSTKNPDSLSQFLANSKARPPFGELIDPTGKIEMKSIDPDFAKILASLGLSADDAQRYGN